MNSDCLRYYFPFASYLAAVKQEEETRRNAFGTAHNEIE